MSASFQGALLLCHRAERGEGSYTAIWKGSAPKEGGLIVEADDAVGEDQNPLGTLQKEMDTVCKQEEEKGRRRQWRKAG